MDEILNHLTYEELVKLNAHVMSGAFGTKIQKRIFAIEQSHRNICATCGNGLHIDAKPFTLVFGPADFKQKASFCGPDCLQQFVSRMQELHSPINAMTNPEKIE